MDRCPTAPCLRCCHLCGRGQPRSGLAEKFGASMICELLMKPTRVWNKLVVIGSRGQICHGDGSGLGWPWEWALCSGPGETEEEGVSLVVAYKVATERRCFCFPGCNTQGDLEATGMKWVKGNWCRLLGLDWDPCKTERFRFSNLDVSH